jgi:hypothetical protein
LPIPRGCGAAGRAMVSLGDDIRVERVASPRTMPQPPLTGSTYRSTPPQCLEEIKLGSSPLAPPRVSTPHALAAEGGIGHEHANDPPQLIEVSCFLVVSSRSAAAASTTQSSPGCPEGGGRKLRKEVGWRSDQARHSCPEPTDIPLGQRALAT